MSVRSDSKLLEIIWLPNGSEAVMVSLSSRFCPARFKPRTTRANARMVVCKGEGFPRFSNCICRVGRACETHLRSTHPTTLVLTLSRNRSVVKIRPR